MKPLRGVEIEETESWKSAIAGLVVIKKYNQKGQLDEFPVIAGRTFQLTPLERRINEEDIPSEDLNPFRNGMLVPVRLLDSEPETAELQANTNAMSETAMKALFKSQKPTFTKKINEISNVIALRRLLEVAEEVDASMAQHKIITERLAEVSPVIGEATLASGPDYGGRMRAVAPR